MKNIFPTPLDFSSFVSYNYNEEEKKMKTLVKQFKKKIHYIHKEIQLGWLRISFYKLGKKFTFRFEIAKGWE